MRAISALILAFSLPLTAGASPYDWRAYPNGERTILFELSEQWLLLDRGAPSPAGLESVLGKVAPEAVLARVETLLADRAAVQVVGLDAEGLRRYGEALIGEGLIGAAWPAAARETGVGFFDDRLAVAFRAAPSPARLEKLGVRLLATSALDGIYRAQAEDGDAIGAAWRLKGQPDVRWAEPDLIRHVKTMALPNDPRLGQQWHLENAEGTGDIDADAAWDVTTGDPEIVVGIFDTGTDMDHPDLVDNIVGGFDAVANDDDPEAGCSERPDGGGPAGSCPANAPYRESHGTAVSGIVAARGGNELLGTGICPDCSLYPVRLLGGGSSFRSLSNAEAFQRAADAGVSVINNSWGPSLTRFFPLASAEREVFDRITTQGRGGLGVVLVFAAGNDFFTPATANPYAAHPGVITVSASTRIDDFACYSNYGSVIAVSGPSQGCFGGESGIATTDYVGGEGYSREDFTTGFGGTSAASPVVAGVVALVLSANPQLTAQQVRLVIQRSAEKIRADRNPWQQEFGVDLNAEFAYDEQGFSKGFGYGRVNAARAVALAIDMPDNVAGICDDACPRCVEGRCAPDCADDAECPGAARCLEVEVGRACVIPAPDVGDIGQPCGADCEICVETVDSRFDEVRICSAACEGDEDCPFGFDCRQVVNNGPNACVPGNQECGARWGEVRCQSEARVIAGGVEFCSCECIPGTRGACPEGFECAEHVFCERTRGGLTCERRENRNQSNYFPMCVPDPNFEQPCEAHRDCPGGLFCIEGTCESDRYRAGCDICAPCNEDDDCARDEVCANLPRGRRCILPCEFGEEGACPGDSVCADVPGPMGDHCVNPDYNRKGLCPSAYRCLVEDRCYLPDDCAEGVECVDRQCQVEEDPDVGVPDAAPVVDAAIEDAGVDAEAELEADATTADASDDEAPRKTDDGCSAAPGEGAPLPVLALLALLGLRRRRR